MKDDQKKALFKPIQFASVAAKNRVVMAPMVANFASPDDEVTDRQVLYSFLVNCTNQITRGTISRSKTPDEKNSTIEHTCYCLIVTVYDFIYHTASFSVVNSGFFP